jgi:hypothetical protein
MNLFRLYKTPICSSLAANDLSSLLLYSLHYLAFQNHLPCCSPDFKFASTSSFNKNYGTPALLVLLFLTRDNFVLSAL